MLDFDFDWAFVAVLDDGFDGVDEILEAGDCDDFGGSTLLLISLTDLIISGEGEAAEATGLVVVVTVIAAGIDGWLDPIEDD